MCFSGFVAANGDFLISIACVHIPFSVAFPIYAGVGLVEGSLLNLMIEGNQLHLSFYILGLVFGIVAIICMSMSSFYPSHTNIARSVKTTNPKDEECRESYGSVTYQKTQPTKAWVAVSLFAGLLTGLWSPLATIGATGKGRINNPYVLVFYFMCGQMLALPIMTFYYGRFIIVRDTKGPPITLRTYFTLIYDLKARDKILSLSAGFIVGIGYSFYFIATVKLPSAIAFAIGACCPLVTISIGAILFCEFRSASLAKRLFVLSAAISFLGAISFLFLAQS